MAVKTRDRPARQTLSRLDAGQLVREARELAGLTQAELAAELGTTQSVVSRWERDVDEPRLSTLGRILATCGLEADLVFRRHEDEDRTQIVERLGWDPADRLRYLQDMIDFEQLAAASRRHRDA